MAAVVLPSESAMTAAILDGFARQLEARVRARLAPLRESLAAAVAKAVRESPEAASLVSGRLRHLLGVVDAGPVLDAVAAEVSRALRLTALPVRRQGGGLTGGLRVEVLRRDLKEVLSVPGGSYVSEGGYEVPWLEWLLVAGERVVVAEHHFAAGFAGRSRTGYGVMVRGGSWSVPGAYAGTAGNNFLTRAVLAAGPEMERAVAREVL